MKAAQTTTTTTCSPLLRFNWELILTQNYARVVLIYQDPALKANTLVTAHCKANIGKVCGFQKSNSTNCRAIADHYLLTQDDPGSQAVGKKPGTPYTLAPTSERNTKTA